jgi:hypothetical protein
MKANLKTFPDIEADQEYSVPSISTLKDTQRWKENIETELKNKLSIVEKNMAERGTSYMFNYRQSCVLRAILGIGTDMDDLPSSTNCVEKSRSEVIK